MADDIQRSNDASAMRRADEALDQAGQRLGMFAVQARQRLQMLAMQSAQAAQGAVNRASETMSHTTADGNGAGDAAHVTDTQASGEAPPPMERAEELVDVAGQRLSMLGQAASQRLQVLFAYLKEEGEDIWAEAQTIRRPAASEDQTTAQP